MNTSMGNAPVSAEYDTRAPWNYRENPEAKFDCIVDYSIYKEVEVRTSDYEGEYDPECGFVPDADSVDLEGAYVDSCYTLPELLAILSRYVRKDIEMNQGNVIRVELLQGVLDACIGWKVSDWNVSLNKFSYD